MGAGVRVGAGVPAGSPAPDPLLREITAYVVDYRVGDAGSLDAARLCLFDALACALEALGQPDCVRLLGPLVPGTVVPGGARLPGTHHVLDPAKAAFDLGTLIRWLDYNDACSGALTVHPSDAIAGVLMLGDYLSRSRSAAAAPPLLMHELLDAIVRIYEIQGALCAHNDFRKHGIDQPLLARVAAAPVLTRMLGGNEAQVLNALSNAFVETTLLAIRHAPNIGSRKSWATASASEGAMRLAFMAMRGDDGYPWILSATDFGFHAARFGGDALRLDGPLGESVIARCMFKLLPAGMHGQTAGECAFLLHPKVAPRLLEVERIDLHCHRALARIMDKPGELRNPADRDHCVQYIVALGLIHGRVGPDDYSDAFAADPRIDALRARMSLTEEPRYTEGFYDPDRRTSANSVEVRFRDGTTTGRLELEYPLGHPRRRAEALPTLRAKFEHALRRLPEAQREHLLALRDDPERMDRMPVHEFVDALASDAGPHQN